MELPVKGADISLVFLGCNRLEALGRRAISMVRRQYIVAVARRAVFPCAGQIQQMIRRRDLVAASGLIVRRRRALDPIIVCRAPLKTEMLPSSLPTADSSFFVSCKIPPLSIISIVAAAFIRPDRSQTAQNPCADISRSSEPRQYSGFLRRKAL